MTEIYSEDTLVEQPALELLRALGWRTANAYNEICGNEPYALLVGNSN